MEGTQVEGTQGRGGRGRAFRATSFVAVPQAAIGGFFLAAGAMKLARVGPDVAIFEAAGLPGRALALAGLANVAGGAGMLLGFWWRALAAPASALIAAYLAFAIWVALLNEDPRDAAQLSVMLALSVAVAAARGGGSGPTRDGGRSPAFREREGGSDGLTEKHAGHAIDDDNEEKTP
ncbi:MAG: hypothetical protein AVDCRST_MAG03-2336 [uncultured Rubrobacteraceae bacterium]|uniref:DoxX family protein n=1 Tax=uncultured Rubrobacteraceae bacterium TaxID=349277 RepID=A0A6J4PLM3_9ACTN|nr:MAG: hypothetical protein AVDCRST_MAG03-2336 [uncultured Rubrobacteraceae bacterium]